MRRFSTLLVLCAWLLATGSHWDLVQSFGWGRMIAQYSQSMPLAEAIRLTFTTDNFCGVCEVVNTARATDPADDDAPPPSSRDLKVQLALLTVPRVVIAAPTVLERFSVSPSRAPTRDDPPPLRPPRPLAA